MKRIIFILALSIGLVTHSYSQNMIIAGQTTGTNIQFTDYFPDLTVIAEQDTIGFNLDLDGNGTNDLYFFVGITDELPFEMWTWSTVKLLNPNVKICLSDENLFWIKRLSAGDTIFENNIWGDNTDTVYYLQKYHYWSYPSPGGESSEGEWQNSNDYLGYQITFPSETFYGWINLETDNFTITAKESAIRGLTVGTSETIKADNKLQFYPNPCYNILTVEYNFPDYKNKRIEILDLNGKIEKSINILGNKTVIETQQMLVPGVYLIQIKEGFKIIAQAKFLKI